MNILYSKDYQQSKTRYRAWHHVGGLGNNPYASTLHLKAEEIDGAHRWRWNFQSSYTKLYGGYNFFIDREGKITQFRAVGEETAANKGHNQNGEVISICFAGNFDIDPISAKAVDIPTSQQVHAAKILNDYLPVVPNKPHRFFNSTNCYGKSLNDGWIYDILKVSPDIEQLSKLQQALDQIRQIIFQLQARFRLL